MISLFEFVLPHMADLHRHHHAMLLRTPNLFLEREAGAGMADELKALTSLLDDAHPVEEDGGMVRPNVMTCIWPEGTRFSRGKREHILKKLRVPSLSLSLANNHRSYASPAFVASAQ
jgi:hypothetical protein